MNECPITFDYKGKTYRGRLAAIFGAGANVWHLMINNYYYGQLQYYPDDTFRFHGNQFEDLGNFFGAVMISFYQ